ncbi:MAG: T9SS type A sorting domain-containing protein [Bacteroidales bacterium]|nr:T9SS type A sorting domain-containing protein [Bacteroidales bacterium]
MRKFLSLFLVLIIGSSSFAQKGTEMFNEDFSASFPPSGWTIDNIGNQWSQSTSANAGGTAPEAKLTYVSGTNTTRLISPAIDLTGISTVLFSFKHFLDDYSGTGYSIGVATRSGGGSWTDIWAVSPTDNIGPETNDLLISNADVGASDFQICIYLSGNTYNFDYWYIDDLILISPDNNDSEMASINISPYAAAGNVDIACTFKNSGINTITSIDVNYQIDAGTIITENLTGLNLATTESLNHTFTTPWVATPGSYTLKVWVSNMNGNGNDDDTNNDLQLQTMSIATQSVTNTPLYEEFTSSTCAPCASFNSSTFTPFMNSHPDDITVVKYQMSWPSPGDPYYTAEGGVRRSYYGVSFVPDLYTGGVNTGTNSTAVTNAYTYETNKPAFFDLSSAAIIDGSNITVDVNITPYITADFKVHIAVIEKMTTGNVGNNGETSFKNVMMKMLPDADGTLVNFVAGTPTAFNETFDMSSTNVEEMYDLKVVVFIQNDATKEVFQSVYSAVTLPPPAISFNPANGATDIDVNSDIIITFNQIMRLVDDSPITDNNVSDFIHLSDPAKGDLTFTASVNYNQSEITITPDVQFNRLTDITVAIDDNEIENIQNISLAGESITFTTIDNTGISQIDDNIVIYPNPANDILFISNAKNSTITISDLSGKTFLKQNINYKVNEINISNFTPGMYFIKIEQDGYSAEKKLNIIK